MYIVIGPIWSKCAWRVVNASKKMRFKTFFIKKSHLIFVWRTLGKLVLSQFLKILEKCLNSIETSSLDSVHPWAHSQILFIIFREFSSSSGCFFQDVPMEAEAAILNLTIWRRSRFRETCSSLCRGSNGNCRKKGNRQPDRKLWMGRLRNQNHLILLWWFQP